MSRPGHFSTQSRWRKHSSPKAVRAKASVGGFGVAGAGGLDPQGAPGGVDEVPEASAGGDFVLPLLHHRSAVGGGGEGAFELVVPRGRRRGVGA